MMPMGDNGLLYRPSTGDYGDASAETFRLGHLLFCYKKFFNEEPISGFTLDWYKAIESLGSGPFNNPNDAINKFARDQHIPLIIHQGAINALTTNDLPQSFWKFQNGDLILPDSSAVIERAIHHKPAPCIDDAFLWPTVLTRCGYLPFWDSGIKKFKLGDPDDVADVLNLTHIYLQCEHSGHSKSSQASMKFFIKHITQGSIMNAIAHYYRKDDWGIVQLYRGIVERIFV